MTTLNQFIKPMRSLLLAGVAVVALGACASNRGNIGSTDYSGMAAGQSQQTLADINRAAANRIVEEMAIQINDIQDIVIQGISSLGAMTPEEFRGPTTNTTGSVMLDEAPEDTSDTTPEENIPEEVVTQDVQEGV